MSRTTPADAYLPLAAFALSVVALLVSAAVQLRWRRWGRLSPAARTRLLEDRYGGAPPPTLSARLREMYARLISRLQPTRAEEETRPPRHLGEIASPRRRTVSFKSCPNGSDEAERYPVQRLPTKFPDDQPESKETDPFLVPTGAESEVEVPFSRVEGQGEQRRLVIDLKNMTGDDARGNQLRYAAWFEGPEIMLPVWPENLDQVLVRLASPPTVERSHSTHRALAAHVDADTYLRQHRVLAAVPRDTHSSAYTLGALLNVAARFRQMEYYPVDLSLEEQHQILIPPVPYAYRSVFGGQVIDTGETYGVHIDFTQYWGALCHTPTKWSQTADKTTLIAHSAWGTTRMTVRSGLLLVELSAPTEREFDRNLFGSAFFIQLDRASHRVPGLWMREREELRWRRGNLSFSGDPGLENLARVHESNSILSLIWRGRLVAPRERGPRQVVHYTAAGMDYLREVVITLSLSAGLERGAIKFNRPLNHSFQGLELKRDCAAIVDTWIRTVLWKAKSAPKVPGDEQSEYLRMRLKKARTEKPSPTEDLQILSIECSDAERGYIEENLRNFFLPQKTLDKCRFSESFCRNSGRFSARPAERDPPCRLYKHQDAYRREFERLSKANVLYEAIEGLIERPLTTSPQGVYDMMVYDGPIGMVAAIELVARIGHFAKSVRVLPESADNMRPWDHRKAYMV